MRRVSITVVVPIFNVSAYIERCILSVMRQTYTDFECILVDDASPDDSIAKCTCLLAVYEGPIRFRILHHSVNRGLSAARCTGVDEASGEYVLFVDSDDEITCDCIEKLCSPIIYDNTIDMVMGNAEEHFWGRQQQKKLSLKCDCEDYKGNKSVRNCFFSRKEMCVYAWNRLIRKDFLKRFHIRFKEGMLWEDYLWIFLVMKHLEHLYIIRDVTYIHFIRPYSITTGTEKKIKLQHMGIVYSEISKYFTPNDSKREARYYLGGFCRNYINCSNSELYKNTARNFRSQFSIWYDPFECFLLYSTKFLSKTLIGRKGFRAMIRIYHNMMSKW